MNRLQGYIHLTRPVNLIIAFISIFIGGFITGTIHPLPKLLMACLSGTLIAAGANAVNDYFDLDIDRINKPNRPLPSGAVTQKEAYIFSLLLFGAGIAVSLMIHINGFIVAVTSAILLYLYSLRLKRTAVWGNLTVAFISGLAFIYGGMALGRIREAVVVGIFAFFYHWAREIIKDVEDLDGDRALGLSTMPIRWGIRNALGWTTVIIVTLIILTVVPFLIDIFGIAYLITVLLGVDLFLVYVLRSMWKDNGSKNLGRLAVWMKADMLIGLLAVYLG